MVNYIMWLTICNGASEEIKDKFESSSSNL